jgi:hypothetical protein
VNDLAAHVLHRDPVVPGIPSSLHTKQFAFLKQIQIQKPGLGNADPHHLMKIRIHLFTLMQIRFPLFTLIRTGPGSCLSSKMMRIFDHHWSPHRPEFNFMPPRLHCERLSLPTPPLCASTALQGSKAYKAAEFPL